MMAVVDDELDLRAIGERLHRHRVRAGLTRAQLAAQVGRSPSWVARAERGELRLDRLSTLHQLSRELRVPLGELIGVRAWGGRQRSLDLGRALRAQSVATARVAGAQLDAGRRRTVAATAAMRRTCGPVVSTAVSTTALSLRTLGRTTRSALALTLMGITLAAAWVVAHLWRLPSSATSRHRRSAFLTVSAVLVSTALTATVTRGFGGVSVSGSPSGSQYKEIPYTTPRPAASQNPAARTPARQPAPVASVPLASLPAAPPAPPPARPAVAPAAVAPDPVTPRVAPAAAPVAKVAAAVTGAVKPVTQTLGQTVGAVTGAVKPVTQTLASVVPATKPVTHVVGSLLGAQTAAQHQQTNPQGFAPLRSLISSWTQAFAHPFTLGSSGRTGSRQNFGGWFLP